MSSKKLLLKIGIERLLLASHRLDVVSRDFQEKHNDRNISVQRSEFYQ